MLYFFDLFETHQLFQLPLVVEDETVATRSPSVQVFLAPDVRRACVEHSTLSALYSCFEINEKWNIETENFLGVRTDDTRKPQQIHVKTNESVDSKRVRGFSESKM